MTGEDSFFDELPEDGELAFIKYALKVKDEIISYDNDGDPIPVTVELYRSRLIQVSSLFELSDETLLAVNTNSAIDNWASAKAYLFGISGLRDIKMLSESRKKHSVVFEYVEIDEHYKGNIRDLVDRIKARIDAADVGVEKRDSLFGKLNLFLNELDKSRTKLTALTAAFVQVSGAVGEAAEKLEPAIELFERIMKAVGYGSKPMPSLPKSEEDQKRLPPPDVSDEEKENEHA
ncbi:hypothetical protein [Agrobacterium rubi]|nr:hypothetical protein [Agrobacterium rubi]